MSSASRITGDTFDRLHRNARYLLDVRPAGRWPAECFYYAGGVPAIMEEIKDHLHLDVMTVTGKTLGENLAELRENGFYEKCSGWLAKFNERYGTSITKKILSARMTRRSERTAASLFCAETLRRRERSSSTRPARKKCSTPSLRARPFDSEEECLDAVLKHKVQKGDAVFIRYEGPKGSGMPEMFYTSEAISSDKELERASRLSPTAVFRRLHRPGHRPPQSRKL